jgi:ribosomal protein S18 acetylase RimI-like enzyme
MHQRSLTHDGVPRLIQLDELEAELDDDLVVLATDTRLATIDGELLGYAYTYHLPSELREERCYVFGTVDPPSRRRGVGTALMGWGIERGAEQLRSTRRTLPRYLRAYANDYIVGAIALFEHMGMAPVRYGEELLRPLTDLPPLSSPAGVTIVGWPADRDEEIRAEKNISFVDHWGSTPTSVPHWQQAVRGYGARPDLSFIALDRDGRVIGHCLNKRFETDDVLLGRSDAWIENLGTLPEWRGRGIASALVAHSLHAFASAGCTHASIGVDSENPTGAARLYRQLGFETQQRNTTYELVID